MKTKNLVNAKTLTILNVGALVWTEGSSQGQKSWSQREATGQSVPRRSPLGQWRRSGPLDHLTVRWRGRNLAMYGTPRQIRMMNCHLGTKMWNTDLVSNTCTRSSWWRMGYYQTFFLISIQFFPIFFFLWIHAFINSMVITHVRSV